MFWLSAFFGLLTGIFLAIAVGQMRKAKRTKRKLLKAIADVIRRQHSLDVVGLCEQKKLKGD